MQSGFRILIPLTTLCLSSTPALAAEAASSDAANSANVASADQGTSAARTSADQGLAPAGQDNGSQLQEITVTATRRKSSIQDVPISISAYGQQSIEKLGISEISDVARLTPGINLTYGNTNTTVVSVRGISSTFVGTATTGVYIDDTPIQVRFLGAGSSFAGAFPSVFDLDRIEVLRGPQGTLWGSSAEGGAVRFITPTPSLYDYSGHARSELSFNEEGAPSTQFGVAGGGPIVDGVLGFRASIYNQQDGGWIQREPYPGTLTADKNTNSSSITAANIAFTWQLSENLRITPSLFYQQTHRDDDGTYWRNLSDPSKNSFVSGFAISSPGTDRFTLPALKVEWNLPGVSLISNTSYMDRAVTATEDYTTRIPPVADPLASLASSNPIPVEPAYFDDPQQQFTQEVRAQSSTPDARLNWVVGAFYQQLKEGATEWVFEPGINTWSQYTLGSVSAAWGTPLNNEGLLYLGIDHSTDKQKAGFGQVDFKIVPPLSVSVGARYSKTTETATNSTSGPLVGPAFGFSANTSETDFTPKYGINFKPTTHTLLYASAARGFRPGGAQAPLPETCASDLQSLGYSSAPSSYKPDHVWSYEFGFKGAADNNRFVWDSSVYYIRWSGIQTVEFLNTCKLHFTANLGTAVSKGFDFQASWVATQSLTLGASLGYDDAYYSQTVYGGGGIGTTPPIVSSGDRLPTAPWHISATVDYTVSTLRNGDVGYFHVDDSYSGGYVLSNPRDADYPPQLSPYSNSFNVATVRVGLRSQSWDVSLFSKNLLDRNAIVDTWNTAPGLYLDRGIPPRTIGLTGTYRF